MRFHPPVLLPLGLVAAAFGVASACLAADAPHGWAITSGNGSATANPPGFATQDAKNPLVVELKDPGADDY
jgi:hypothetical protein